MNHVILQVLAILFIVICASGQDYGYTGDVETHEFTMKFLELVLKSKHAKLDGLIDDRDIRITADDISGQMSNSSIKSNVTKDCWRQVKQLIESMSRGEKWALAFVDAFGKPTSGLMTLNLAWLGDYKQCVNGENMFGEDSNNPVQGKYCMAKYMIPDKELVGRSANVSFPLRIGLCYPSSCSSADAQVLLDLLIKLTSLNTSTWSSKSEISCQERGMHLDTRATVVLSVCGVVVVLILTGTAIDIFYAIRQTKTSEQQQHDTIANTAADNIGFQHDDVTNNKLNNSFKLEMQNSKVKKPTTNAKQCNAEKDVQAHLERKQGILITLLRSFSFYTNVKTLLATGDSTDSLASIQGLRLFGTLWVISSHSYSWFFNPGAGNMFMVKELMTRFTFLAFSNGTYSVDVFFALSGILVAYSTLKEIAKRGGVKRFQWAMFYSHRYWRLTPVYVFWIIFYSSLMKYWTNGPLWNQEGFEKEDCKDMWRNVLYINNLVNSKNHCMAWAYYLAIDMQFYILSPLMLIPLYLWPRLGVLSCLAFLLTGAVSSGVITTVYDLPPAPYYDIFKIWDYMNKMYYTPWCRVGPFAVGVFTGHLMYRNNLKVKIPVILSLLGWILAVGLGVLVVYGLHSSDGIKYISPEMTAVYNAIGRSVFGACVSWVVFACVTGHGGPINAILSWPGFAPLSRLTYCAYLVHPVFLTLYLTSRQTVFHLEDYALMYVVVANIVISFAAAFLLSMAMERPFMLIEKIMFGGKARR